MRHKRATGALLALAECPRVAEFDRIVIPMLALPSGVHSDVADRNTLTVSKTFQRARGQLIGRICRAGRRPASRL
jgi:hypothetical protein